MKLHEVVSAGRHKLRDKIAEKAYQIVLTVGKDIRQWIHDMSDDHSEKAPLPFFTHYMTRPKEGDTTRHGIVIVRSAEISDTVWESAFDQIHDALEDEGLLNPALPVTVELSKAHGSVAQHQYYLSVG